ncbi:heat shock 70 kDa protein 12A-like [Mytilus californianus]|uniref:heat shock 70 kDa protein 12A-like n=1 Tax=Mytilus californianus TaxID=6549 RepID=UPI002244FEB1|nr:heat shock 70 kDa protein 12A-like [Mytilus californianus]XP_052067533.1 heat shock 70 kDa protein 12A-like [Mytilus californianus]
MAESDQEKYVVGIDFGTAYSGYAYASSTDFGNDPPTYYIAEWKDDKHASKKAPSTVLLDGMKNFVAFGYEAERQYSEHLESDDHRQYYYFTQFKMVLYNQLVRSNTPIIDFTEKQMEAMEVYTKIIQYFKSHVKGSIKKKTGIAVKDDQLFFVFTIPAAGTDAAEKFIQEAAKHAEIMSTHITIAVEPIVASMFCKALRTTKRDGASNSSSTIEAGMKYMVIDLGGGYTDITVHQKQINGSIQEIIPHCGNPYGGTSVDEEFLKLLAEIFGKNVMEEFKRSQNEDFKDLCDQFEFKKRIVKTEMSITISLSSSFMELVLKVRNISADDAVKKYRYKNEIYCSNQRLNILKSGVKRLFGETIESLMKSIEHVLSDAKVSDLVNVIMVGGFSQNELVEEAVRKHVGTSMNVIIPEEAEIAVLKGALIYGFSQQKDTRILPDLERMQLTKRPPCEFSKHSLTDKKNRSTTKEVYKKGKDERGFLLVINFEFAGRKDERTGSQKDVDDLKTFFETLKYHVECRSDISKEELEECLKDIRDTYLIADADKYYSFFCIVMSHGNAEGIKTCKGTITTDEIVEYFKTSKTKPFKGKPKVFFFDMCREKPKPIIGEPEVLSNAPESDSFHDDSDTLIVYAATEGNRSYLMPSGKWIGSFFIQAFLSVAEGSLHIDVEDILRDVRRELANNSEYARIGKDKCMLSESETRLSKKIYL